MNKPKLYQECSGYCPESTLEGKKVRMRLNRWDLYESEETGLQIALIRPLFAVILKFRGKGDFRLTPEYLDEVVDAEMWAHQLTDKPPFYGEGKIFENGEEDIKQYLSTIPRDNINRKGISYYANLANEILDTDLSLPYLASKQSIQSMFSGNKLTDYQTSEAERIIRSRLALIDGFYSTNVGSRRLFAFDDIVNEIIDFADSDNEFIGRINSYLETIEGFYELDEESIEFKSLIEKQYGIDKTGKTSGVVKSLFTKYCYFLTQFQFPIYDSLVKDNYKEIATKFKINLNKKTFYSGFDKFINDLSIMDTKIGDYNKLDNLIWLYGKIKKGSYSLVLTKENYIKLVNLVNSNNAFSDIQSEEIDNVIVKYVKANIEEIEKNEIFSMELIEFVRFVMQ